MKSRVLLLASAHSYRTALFEQAAEKLGVITVRGEDVPPPMLGKVNVPLAVDYQDVPHATRQIEQYAQTHPIGAILGLDDSGTLIAAAACNALGLPYNAPDAAQAARDKHIMRQRFAEAGVPSPTFRHYRLTDEPEEIADEVSYPCVIKPTTLAGSRGVMRANNPIEFMYRYARLKEIMGSERCDEFLVEDFIPGVEVALEGTLHNGQLTVLALFDKPDPLDGPFFEETIYVTPSRLPAETQQVITEVTALAAAALGLRTGPIHAELRVDNGNPVLVELGARTIGGLCSKTLRFGTDMSLEELNIRQALGMPVDVRREKEAGGVMMIPIPAAGVLQKVEGLAEAARVPLIEDLEITAQLNTRLRPIPEGDSYLGFIFARGDTPEAVEAALREAHGKLHFHIAPEMRVFPTSQ